MKKLTVKDISLIAMMAAVLCVIGPLTIPLPGLVPLSLATLVLYFAAYLLGPMRSFLCCAVYLLIGFAGLPVFSGWTGGLARLAGPTGGYLIGYMPLTFISALGIKYYPKSKVRQAVFMVLGTSVLYLTGSSWLSIITGVTLKAALISGALPFIAGDAVKIAIAVFCSPLLISLANRKHW